MSLLERSDALAQLEAALDRARAGPAGRLVMVGGEAGVGKTTLVRAFCADGAVGHLRSALHAAAARPDPRDRRAARRRPPGARRRRGASASRRRGAPDALATAAPAIVVLEDVHWADEATLDVLRLLARRLDRGPCSSATYRDDELTRAHPLRLVLGELAAAAAVERRRLEPLSPAAVRELAGARGRRRRRALPATAATRSSSPRCSRRRRRTFRTRCATRCSPARRDWAAARVRCSRRSRSSAAHRLRLLEAIAGAVFDSLDECIAAGMSRRPGGRSRSATSSRACAIEESCRPTRGWRSTARPCGAGDRAEPDLARLAHHADAAGRRRRRPALRAARGRARRGGRRAPGGRRAVRAGAALRDNQPLELLRGALRAYESYATGQIEAAIGRPGGGGGAAARAGRCARVGRRAAIARRGSGVRRQERSRASRPPARPWSARGAPARPRARDGVRHARAAPPELGEHRPRPGARREGARARDGRERRRG